MSGVLFVCLGNICRSPTAEALMRRRVLAAGLADEIEIDSAGTGDWHVGHAPDRRAQAAALERGVELSGRARQVQEEDFERFDVIVALDRSVLASLQSLAAGAKGDARLRLLLPGADVPDPYYGGDGGFAHVFDLIDAACAELLAELTAG